MFVFKRNQIIITALVFMVSIAAYLNFTDNKNAVQPTFEGDGEKITAGVDGAQAIDENYDDFFTTYEFADIDTLAPDDPMEEGLTAEGEIAGKEALVEEGVAGEGLVEEGIAENSLGQDQTTHELPQGNIIMSLKDKMMAENKDAMAKANPKSVDNEEVVLVSNSYDVNYFVEAKMDREQKRSEQIEMLSECIGSGTLDKDSKSSAATNLITLQERIEKESAIESLLKAKGFKEVFVRMSDNDVDVVINREKIEEADIAQIEDIVRRKTGYATSQIKISPLKN
ncbi:MAG TPA: SpoIIIAH-like family protein [Epulopiscium sp.]|nr:SpoIIIAH-like family protein [Candidatus Epulonipiscium sp.]